MSLAILLGVVVGVVALSAAFFFGVLWGSRTPIAEGDINAIADAYAWGRRDEQREWEARANGAPEDDAPTARTPGWVRRDIERR